MAEMCGKYFFFFLSFFFLSLSIILQSCQLPDYTESNDRMTNELEKYLEGSGSGLILALSPNLRIGTQ
jgi:hypothetical protein